MIIDIYTQLMIGLNLQELVVGKLKINDLKSNWNEGGYTIKNEKLNYANNIQATDSSKYSSPSSDVRRYRDGLEKSKNSRADKADRERPNIQSTPRDVSKTEPAQTQNPNRENRPSNTGADPRRGSKNKPSCKSVPGNEDQPTKSNQAIRDSQTGSSKPAESETANRMRK